MEQKKPQMIYKNLGKTGLRVSAFGCGLMVLNEKEAMTNVVKAALDAGVNFFDTAEFYGSGVNEKIFGEVLQDLKVQRENIVISTKIFFGIKQEKDFLATKTKQTPFGPADINAVGTSRKHVIEGIKASLKRLQTDYVDVVYASRPDNHTPLEETCRAFDWVVRKGYALYWGTSEWPAKKIRDAIGICEKLNLHKPITEECQYSMLERTTVESDFAELFEEYGLGTTIWAPLCRGILAGKYNKDIPENSRYNQGHSKMLFMPYFAPDKIDNTRRICLELEKLAGEVGCKMAHLAINWCIRNKDVSVALVGASNIDQFNENLEALEHYEKYTREVDEKVEAILKNQPNLGMDFRELAPKKGRRQYE